MERNCRSLFTLHSSLFPFTVALISCLLGIVLAYADGLFQPLHAVLVLFAGTVLQVGANLVNDFFEFKQGNDKRRGLAVVLVFFMMGVLMIAGSYYAVAGVLNPHVVWIALPVSGLVSLLLLSNELRDYEDDTRHDIGTLTVRIGYRWSVRAYLRLVGFAYLSTAALVLARLFPHAFLVLLSLLALRAQLRFLEAPARRGGPSRR